MTTEPPVEALATTDGAALAGEIVDGLEAELVRFCHRVDHDHGIELDRARAALVLLGRLVSSGVRWQAMPDSDPAKIHQAFSSQLTVHPQLAPILKREIAAFFAATADVPVIEDTRGDPYAMMRRAGAELSTWWWAAQFDSAERCWVGCGDDCERLIQAALAFGVATDRTVQALAAALVLLVNRIKTRLSTARGQLAGALQQVASGPAALADSAVSGTITKLAFEMKAAQSLKDDKPDPLAEVAVVAFQLIEAAQTATKAGRPDLERFATVAGRVGQMFAARGLVAATVIRKELDPIVSAAIG